MSVYNIKSQVLQVRDNTGLGAPLDPARSVGQMREIIGVNNTSESGASLGAAGTKIRLLTVPSSARLTSLDYCSAVLGTSSLDVAVWYPTTIHQGGQNAPAASSAATLISSSAFASAISVNDAGAGWTDAIGTIAQATAQKRVMPLWQAVGLSTDPGIDLDIGFSLRAAVVTNGYVGLRARYIMD